MTLSVDTALEAALRRDRLIVVAALAAVVALSWAYLLAGAGMGMSGLEMTRMSQHELSGNMHHVAVMQPAAWTPGWVTTLK